MSRPALLGYLAEVGARGFALEAHRDCCTFMADWLLRLGLPDVMADRRGTYSTVRQFQRMLESEGGLLAACERRFTGAGLMRALVPGPGDVAVVRAPYALRSGRILVRSTGAIALTERHMAMLGRRHLISASGLPVEGVWSLA